ncbi:HEAT repeat domain-containing protein [Vallitalea pronyensis]|uniref:HEAT repeat domain-containing protein n=1 Tax=Vallitalea pronyensis TaxID=1348613 RepID=A0A8J8SFG8_9FIRM|nr:HEAT repeat domain-containing protein [Vallitalea pronyensis]QUI21238.1 HEAT repeat domain-containing protein [Vallitalea pronyensis]
MTQEEKMNRIEELKIKLSHKSLKEIMDFLNDESLEVKLSAVEALASYDAFVEARNILLNLTKNADSEIRYYAIEALGHFGGHDIEQIIIKRLRDSDELVRIVAIQTLGDIQALEAIDYLKETIIDRSELVRGIGAEILGKLGDEGLIPVLEKGLHMEKKDTAIMGFYIGLYWLQQKKYLDSILNMLKNNSYRIRCAAANSLLELADNQNAEKIMLHLREALLIEETNAVRSSILNILDQIP